MSAPKFTPGPWVANGYHVEGPLDPRSKHASGRVLVGGVVDDLKDWRNMPPEAIDDRSEFKAETKANAALIAAAPELYAALDDAINDRPNWRLKARNALGKAAPHA